MHAWDVCCVAFGFVSGGEKRIEERIERPIDPHTWGGALFNIFIPPPPPKQKTENKKKRHLPSIINR